MKVFSPSATSDFLKCPLYWRTRRRGLSVRKQGKRDLSGILGTAFAAGVAAYNFSKREGVECTPARVKDYGEIAASVVTQHLKEADNAGLICTGLDVAMRASLPDRARKLLKVYADLDPIPTQWTVRDVELTLESAGRARLDLSCMSQLGPVVLDYKTKISYDEKWMDRDRDDWRDSEQRYHYSYFYGELVGEPVWQFAIILLILEPRPRIHLLPWVNKPEALENWYRRRLMTWSRMEACEELELRDVEHAAVHADRFGPCDMRRHCLENEFDLDVSVNSGDYVIVDRHAPQPTAAL